MRRKLSSFISRSNFRRNFAQVASANVVAQIFVVAMTPILARLFTPTQFGVAAFALAAIQIGTSITNWRFERLIPSLRDRHQQSGIVRAGLIATMIIILIVGTILFASQFVDGIGQITTLAPFAVLIALSIGSRGIMRLCQSAYVRLGRLARVASGRMIDSLAEIVIAILAGLIGFGAGGLIFAYMLAPMLSTLWLIHPRVIRKFLFTGVSRSELKQALTDKMRLATEATAPSALNSISMNSIIFFLGYGYDLKSVALFAFIRRVALMPVNLFSMALAQSFWSHVSILYRKERYREINRTYLRIVTVLCGFAFALVLASFAVAPFLTFIFGEQWAGIGEVLLAILPLLVGVTLFGSTNHLIVFDSQRWQILVDAIRLGLIFLVFLFAQSFNWSFIQSVFLMSTASAIAHLSLFFLQILIHRKAIREQGVDTFIKEI